MEDILTDELLRSVFKQILSNAVYILSATGSLLIKMYLDLRKAKQDLNNAFKAIRRLERDYGRYSENYRKITTRVNYGEICEKDDCSPTGSCSQQD